MAAQEVLAEAPRGPRKEGLEGQILKKACIVQSAPNAAKGAKFLSSLRARSLFIAAVVFKKMTGLNHAALPRVNSI